MTALRWTWAGPIAALLLLAAGAAPVSAAPVRTELAGNPLGQFPSFEYVRAFNADAAVQVTIDPARFPAIVGETCDIRRERQIGFAMERQPGSDRRDGRRRPDPRFRRRHGPDQRGRGGRRFPAQRRCWNRSWSPLRRRARLRPERPARGRRLRRRNDRRSGLLRRPRHDDVRPADGRRKRLSGPGRRRDRLRHHAHELGEKIYFPTNVGAMGGAVVVVSHGNGHQYNWSTISGATSPPTASSS